jgi:hypothetical protein
VGKEEKPKNIVDSLIAIFILGIGRKLYTDNFTVLIEYSLGQMSLGDNEYLTCYEIKIVNTHVSRDKYVNFVSPLMYMC